MQNTWEIQKSLMEFILNYTTPELEWKFRRMSVDTHTHTLTGAMILVPQCNNLQEMLVQGLQSKKNLHREYREGYLTQ